MPLNKTRNIRIYKLRAYTTSLHFKAKGSNSLESAF